MRTRLAPPRPLPQPVDQDLELIKAKIKDLETRKYGQQLSTFLDLPRQRLVRKLAALEVN